MSSGDPPTEKFGCESCWPAAAEAAWQARRTLFRAFELIDESHFHVLILACPGCGQRFLSIFTETIDWDDGDDSQYWTLMPVTEAEAVELRRQPGPLDESQIEAVGAGRRCLRRAHPKGEKSGISWGNSIFIGMYD